jgi:tripartite-type tricarboxylate transporter receptor subunit TctC
MDDADLKRALSDTATRSEYGGPADLARYTASEIERYRPIIDAAGGRQR